jgi:putative CocE/NonD family hydrolase
MNVATRLSTAVALLMSVSVATQSGTARQADPGASFARYKTTPVATEALTTSQYLPMRDGVRLAMSITRPSKDGRPLEGRYPVIWQHALSISTPGMMRRQNDAAGYGAAPTLAYDGYVVVQVARRGQGSSFGKRRGYNDRSEAYDAYEVIDWLASQSWSTGKVGMYGCSNTGDAAMHAVTAANPHLKAVWAGCFSWDKYDGFWRGGIYANWGTGPERTLEQDMTSVPVQGDESKALLRMAAEEHQGATVLTEMWQAMPFRDDYAPGVGTRFWYEGSVATYLPQIRQSGTAIYIQGGWRDDLRAQGLLTFANLQGDRHVILGPWGHCQSDGVDLVAEMHRFFDQHLKGINTGMLRQDPIHYFTVNAPPGKEWRSARTWPVGGTETKVFYFDGQGSGGGALATTKPSTAGGRTVFTVRYDVDAPGAPPRAPGLLTGAPPRPVDHGGPRFVTSPLAADTEVTGDAVVDLWMSSTATDGNIFLYLEDVAPDGHVTQVTDARLKASVRKLGTPQYDARGLPFHPALRADVQPLMPGEPIEMEFAFLPTSYIFKAGHRIRISVAGADYRERDRTPVVPAPVVTLYNTSQHASRVTLPVVNR